MPASCARSSIPCRSTEVAGARGLRSGRHQRARQRHSARRPAHALRHGPQPTDYADTRIVVIEIELDGEPALVGVIADKVYEVTEISQTDMQQTPRVGMHWQPEFIRFIAKWREDSSSFPNMERILN